MKRAWLSRLNLSYGASDSWKRIVDEIRSASVRLGREVGILAPLEGPKVRLGELIGGQAHLAAEE